MRDLVFSLPAGDRRPAYLRIAGGLREAIQSGQARAGEGLPSTRFLAERMGVHRHTVMAALEELVAQGWVVAEERRGYRIAETARGDQAVAGAHAWRIVRQVLPERSLEQELQGIRYPFLSGQPDLRLFPHAEFRSHVSDALRRPGCHLLQYGDPVGHAPFIAAVRTYLRRARAVDGREIVVTHGSQEAIYLIAQALLAPGDAVAVEGLGYSPAWEAFRSAGARLVPIAVDESGLDPDPLARALARGRIRLLYLTPLHQYPTTVTLPAPRRLRIYELAARYGVPILEDDYDHEFHYRSQPPAPLASRDPEGIVIYVSTFSKVLFPSARLGFVAAPPGLAESIIGFRRIVSRQNDSLMQAAVARWIADGGFERHLRRMRRAYEERRDEIVRCIEETDPRLGVSCRAPDGGMALWMDTGRAAESVVRRARALGVYAVGESAYRLEASPDVGTHLRLGFANQTPAEIRAGMRCLLEAVRATPPPAPSRGRNSKRNSTQRKSG